MSDYNREQELKKVFDRALTIPAEVVMPVATEIAAIIRQHAIVYAGPLPGSDTEAYKEWTVKMDAFHLLVAKTLKNMRGFHT